MGKTLLLSHFSTMESANFYKMSTKTMKYSGAKPQQKEKERKAKRKKNGKSTYIGFGGENSRANGEIKEGN
jgi:hypothetical protein